MTWEFNPPVEAGFEGLGVMEGALEFPIVQAMSGNASDGPTAGHRRKQPHEQPSRR